MEDYFLIKQLLGTPLEIHSRNNVNLSVDSKEGWGGEKKGAKDVKRKYPCPRVAHDYMSVQTSVGE